MPDAACYWYKKRFRFETYFSDEESRGFYIHKVHLSDPERLGTLMSADCLAYLWIIYLGLITIREHWTKLIHRADRCDWSLFHMDLALLDFFLSEKLPIPVAFTLSETKCVW